MDGKYLAELMNNSQLKRAIAKHARRHSSVIENQEEYIQEAWFRISKQEEGETMAFYEREAGKSIHAAWKKNYRSRVDNNNTLNVHGNSIREVKDPKKYVMLERGKYIKREPETLDSWYYDGEWNDWALVNFNGKKKWILKRDAEHHEIYPHWTMDKSYSKKWRVHNAEVAG